jgi:hypothetical protein
MPMAALLLGRATPVTRHAPLQAALDRATPARIRNAGPCAVARSQRKTIRPGAKLLFIESPLTGVHRSPLGCGPVGCRWHKGFGPGVHESTDIHPLKKHPCSGARAELPMPSGFQVQERQQAKRDHHHARDTAGSRAEHLLWAMARGKSRCLRTSNAGPLPIMSSLRAPDSGPSTFRSEISQGIAHRRVGDLRVDQKEISAPGEGARSQP